MKIETSLHFKELNEIKKTLFFRVNNKLQEYFAEKKLPKEVKETILDMGFIQSNPSYYLYYPYLYSNYFEFEDENTLDLIAIASFLYYKSIIFIDEIFDNENATNKFQTFLLSNICQEESLKILSSFFDKDHQFWDVWNLRKHEYAKAYKIDKSIKSFESFEEFENLADYKSAFGKIAIDILYFLSEGKAKNTYQKLLLSHKYFYTGFQILDDITDFKEDTESGQYNIARQELFKKISKEEKEKFNIDELNKLLYLKGTAEELYLKAIKSLKKSIVTLKEYEKSNQWLLEVYQLHNTAVKHKLNITGYKCFFEENKTPTTFLDGKNIYFSIDSAKNFINSKFLETEGYWNDLYTDSGINNVKATVFISQKHINDKTSTTKFIKNSVSENGFWSVNKGWIYDAETTILSLLALKEYNQLATVLSFQNEDGGFSKYNNKNAILATRADFINNNLQGYLQSHFVSSALAYCYFVNSNNVAISNYNKLRDYLLTVLKSDVLKLSYWYSNDFYGLRLLLESALKIGDKGLVIEVEKRIDTLLKERINTNFDIAFLITSLCLSDNLFKKYNIVLEKLISNLKSQQLKDGSWVSSQVFLEPNPSEMKTDTINEASTIKVNYDFNRVITTASCLEALERYEQRNK